VAKKDILYRDGGNMCGLCDRKNTGGPPTKSGRQPNEGQRQALPCLLRKTDGNNLRQLPLGGPRFTNRHPPDHVSVALGLPHSTDFGNARSGIALQSFDDLLCIVLIVSLTLCFCTSSRTKLTIVVNSFWRLRRLKLFGSDSICSLIPSNSRSSFGHMARN
jgi:hypothetical protein